MNESEELGPELADWAALHALGCPNRAELEHCEQLWRASAAYRSEVERLRALSHELCAAVPPVQPPAALWPRVLARVRSERDARPIESAPAPHAAQPWKNWKPSAADAAPFSYVPVDGAGFEPTAIPGIEVRRLALDPAARRTTMMIRMAPHTSYPPHRHAGPEECYVLSGELCIGNELRMRAGDFQRAERGSEHPLQWTEIGCVLLLVSSLEDELIESAT
jgi:quercetin dioxygenase-like cupin family protein